MRYLLDTTFIIDHVRGDPGARAWMRRLVESGDFAFVDDIVVAEAWDGAHSDDDPDLTALFRFLEFVQPGPERARQAGRWRANVRRLGRTLSLADALIGASASSMDAIVVTRNERDFALMPIPVEVY
jgi:predicted nucleic acid-binding protein